MQANVRLLDRVHDFKVRTKYDEKKMHAASVSGHRVLVGLGEELFCDIVKGEERNFSYPAGTGYMFNGEQKIYQIFPHGMYEMLRSKGHAVRGEKIDSKDMRGMTQLTFDFICRLRTWTLIGDEGKDFTDESLLSLAKSLDRPKRNERKLTAADRFRKAAKLKTEARAKRMPMPSAFTAAAGAKQLDLRRADVQSILGWIDPERLAVFELVEGVHMRLDDAWRVMSPQAFAQPGHSIAIASCLPTPQAVKVMRDHLRPIYRGLHEIKVQPLNGLADEAAVALNALVQKITKAKDAVDISVELSRIREKLALMRIVRALEMDVIMPLSMLLHNWKRLEAHKYELARDRTTQACARLAFELGNDLEFLAPERAADILERVRSAQSLSRAMEIDPRPALLAVKASLKRLSHSLV